MNPKMDSHILSWYALSSLSMVVDVSLSVGSVSSVEAKSKVVSKASSVVEDISSSIVVEVISSSVENNMVDSIVGKGSSVDAKSNVKSDAIDW